MRVLSITAQKPTATGSGVYLSEVVKCLSVLGHDQAIVYGRSPEDSTPEIQDLANSAYPITFEEGDLNFPIAGMSDNMPYISTRYCDFTPEMTRKFVTTYAKTIMAAITEFAPDLILCHHLYLATAIAQHVNSTLLKLAKVVAICHGTDLRQMHKHELAKEYIKCGISELDQAYALHSDQIDDIVKTYGIDPAKVDIIGTGYNADVFNSNMASSSRIPNSIVYAGKICFQKGVSELIYAADALAKEVSDITLMLAGGHSNKDEYEEIVSIANSVDVDVRFAGKLTQTELAKLYAESQVFCLPSFFEGLPLVSLEALACGCTCVMTDLPGIREWYSKNAENSPIVFVKPPKMSNVDIPVLSDLPNFREDLKEALKQALSMKPAPETVEHLSWMALTKRLLEKVERL